MYTCLWFMIHDFYVGRISRPVAKGGQGARPPTLRLIPLHALTLGPHDAISTQQIHVHLRIARAVYLSLIHI